jgi:hypothetical protein
MAIIGFMVVWCGVDGCGMRRHMREVKEWYLEGGFTSYGGSLSLLH